MNTNLIRAAVVVCLLTLIPNIANAFYAAHMGRWTSRDPLSERLGVGSPLHAGNTFVDRDSVRNFSAPQQAAIIDSSTEMQMRNLYEYCHGNPVVGDDPSGLFDPFFGWNYGNYCGYNKRATCPPGSGAKPVDAIDAACERHDCCLATLRDCWKITSCDKKLCNEAHDAYNFGCKQSYAGNPAAVAACKKAAQDVAFAFCWFWDGVPGQDPPILIGPQ